jgi:hypothetical protein
MIKKTYDVKIMAKVTLDDDARPPDVVLFDANEVLDRIKENGKVYGVEYTTDDTPREGGE